MLSSFMFMVLILMMIFRLMWLLVLSFMFQRVMMMAENRLIIIFPVQPCDKGFIEIDHVHSQGDHVQGIFHVELDPELVVKKDAKVRKK